MNKLILSFVVLVIVIAGIFIWFKISVQESPISVPQTTVQNSTTTNSGNTSANSNYKIVGNGTSKKYTSPDGKYIAVSVSDEQGDSAISITDASGKVLTSQYCGFYSSWSSDSAKVKVLVPPECGYGNQEQYYYLDTNGTREAVEGSLFVPNAQ